ncbi:tetratricopeptide repeat protein [bacterium]|nr:tetratricopeptide repeat protein [bacterium]MDC1221074.1 tetratricopeptide repeat protein [Salibacteraceae bacterium]
MASTINDQMARSKESKTKKSATLLSKQWAQLLIVCFLGFALYAGSFNHGFVLDDNLVITSNKHVQNGFSGIPDLLKFNYAHGHAEFNDGLYRPLSLVSFAFEKDLFGLDNRSSHIVQVLIYLILLVVLLLWLKSLFDERSYWPLLITLVFAAHPIHTEVVANLKSRDEILALLFFCIAALNFTKWLKTQNVSNLILGIIAMFIASFSKESAVTFAAIFPLIAWYKSDSLKKSIVGCSIFSAPIFIFLLIRMSVLSELGPVDTGVTSLLQNSLIENDGFVERICTGAVIQGLYFLKLFIPYNLSHDYSYNAIEIANLTDPIALAWLLVLVVALAAGFVGLKLKRWWGFGIIFYFITISAVSNVFILIGAMAAERFVFAPSLGFSIALVCGLHWIIKNRKYFFGTIVSIILAYSLLTIIRVPDWESNFTLFSADVDKVSNSARAQYDAGSGYIEAAKTDKRNSATYLDKARVHLNKAIEIWPDYQDAYNNLGISYMNTRDYENAYKVYSAFINKFPSYSKARYNMAMTCYNLKRYDEAELHLENYIDNGNINNDALYVLAEAEGFQQKFTEATKHLELLVKNEPNKERGHLKLATAYAIAGNISGAEKEFTRSLEINPNNADTYANLGLLYLNSNRPDEARRSLKTAVSINPNNANAQALLSQIPPN